MGAAPLSRRAPNLQIGCDLAVGVASLDGLRQRLGEPPPAAMLSAIAHRMVDDLLDELGWTGRDGAPALPPETIERLASAAAEAGGGTASLRDLRRALRGALGAAVLGEDALAAGMEALEQASQRDDRPYRGAGRLGYAR